jgi:hypothetical protein
MSCENINFIHGSRRNEEEIKEMYPVLAPICTTLFKELNEHKTLD